MRFPAIVGARLRDGWCGAAGCTPRLLTRTFVESCCQEFLLGALSTRSAVLAWQAMKSDDGADMFGRWPLPLTNLGSINGKKPHECGMIMASEGR